MSKVLLRPEIIEKVRNTCAPPKGIGFTNGLLREKLKDWTKAEENQKLPIAKNWNKKFKDFEGDPYSYKEPLSTQILERALPLKATKMKDLGATLSLADLLCYFIPEYNNSFEEVLERYFDTTLEQEIKRTEQLKKFSGSNVISTDKKISCEPFIKVLGKFDILILPFRNPNPAIGISTAGEDIYLRLQLKKEVERLNIDVKYLPWNKTTASYPDAHEIGQSVKAHIVIWGTHSTKGNQNKNVIYFHYVILNVPEISKAFTGKTQKVEIEDLIQITEGELQLEIDDIIYWLLAKTLQSTKDYKKALEYYHKISYDFDTYITEDLFIEIGSCYRRLNFLLEALQYYLMAELLNPKSFLAHAHCAATYYDLFKLTVHSEKFPVQTKECIEGSKFHFKKALAIEPNNAIVLSYYALFLFYFDVQEAEKFHIKAIANGPDFCFVHDYYATFLRKIDLEGNKIKIHYHYRKAIKCYPNYALTNFNYGTFLFIIKKYDKARIYLKKACDLNFQLAFSQYGALLFAIKEIEKAKKYYLKAIELDQRDYLSIFIYLKIVVNQEDKFKADKEIKKYIKMYPSDIGGYFFNSVFILYKGYDKIDLKKSMQKCLEWNPNITEAELSAYLIRVGKAVDALYPVSFL